MDLVKGFNGFDLDYYLSFDYKIGNILTNNKIVVANRNRFLLFCFKVILFKFDR